MVGRQRELRYRPNSLFLLRPENPGVCLCYSLVEHQAEMSLFSNTKIALAMIKFEHTVFALPFALLSALLASEGWPGGQKILWIVVAMVGARSAAMAFNRLADVRIDALNPRTSNRALPAGHLSRLFVTIFTLASASVFVLAAYQLNPLCFSLSFPVLLILLLYSYTKQFTRLSHLYLGLCLGLAPLGSWIAVRGEIGLSPLLLGLAVLLWTAGFDIIYACQDLDFDRRQSLFSIPEGYGIERALKVSRRLHIGMLLTLLGLVWVQGLGWISLLGILLIAGLLWQEHRLVRPNDLSRINAAFFTVNSYVSILLMLALGLDELVN